MIRYAVASLPAALWTLRAKQLYLAGGGFATAARSLGRSEEEFGLWEQLSFFRMDLLVDMGLLPLLCVGVAAIVRPRWRAFAVGTVMALILVAFQIQYRALGQVGSWTDVRLLLSAIRFAGERPGVLREYIALGDLVRIPVIIAAGFALAWWAPRRQVNRRIASVVALACLAILVTAWLPRIPRTVNHRSLLARALTGYWTASHGGPLLDNVEHIRSEYRLLSGIDPNPPDRALWGLAPDNDVVLYVMETVPARCTDFTGGLDDMPSIRRLRSRALHATRHYTTYPYSSLANFSLLSSWYPPGLARSYVQRRHGGRVPGLLWHLRARGYHTAVYEPYLARFESDSVMFNLLGAERHVAPGGQYDSKPEFRTIAARDSASLAIARQDIAAWLTAGQRYAVVLLPQISHGPWQDPVPGRTGLDLLQRCRALVALQDRWIGQLIEVIERHGRLDRTLFVVTADHGVRTRTEDPSLAPGSIDAYSFRVPLLVHAPAAFPATRTVDVLTSAIDIQPTLLDLLGIERDRALEQGLPLTDPRLDARTTFFLARHLFGADGLRQGNRFLSANSVSGTVCAADEMRCDPGDMLPAGPLADSIVSLLRRMNQIQTAWLETMPRAATSP